MLVTTGAVGASDLCLKTVAAAASYGLIDGSTRLPVLVEEYRQGDILHADMNCPATAKLDIVTAAQVATFDPDHVCTCTLALGQKYAELTDTLIASVPELRWLRLAQSVLEDPTADEGLRNHAGPDTDVWVPLWRPQVAAQLLSDAAGLHFEDNLAAARDQLSGALADLAAEANDEDLTSARKRAVVQQCTARLRAIHADALADPAQHHPERTVTSTLLDNQALSQDLVRAVTPGLERLVTGSDDAGHVWVVLPELTQHSLGSELDLEYTTMAGIAAWAEPGMSVSSHGRSHWEILAGTSLTSVTVVPYGNGPARIAKVPVAALVVAESWTRRDWTVTVTGDDTVSADAVLVALAATAAEEDGPVDWDEILHATCAATA